MGQVFSLSLDSGSLARAEGPSPGGLTSEFGMVGGASWRADGGLQGSRGNRGPSADFSAEKPTADGTWLKATKHFLNVEVQ